jgi:uncharacterized protein (DUF305 family)
MLKNARLGDRELIVLLTLGIVLLGGLALWLFFSSRMPADDSAEAGFARDMSVHHAQAVELAELLRDRTQSEEMRTLAADMALTQQGQIGQMQGWLAIWGLPNTGSEPAMSWMGEPTNGQMPGMATPEQINELSQASGEDADERFLQLMIPHHQAAIPMSKAILERTDRPEVKTLAEAIIASQEAEIKTMQEKLESMGAPLPEEPRMVMDGEK